MKNIAIALATHYASNATTIAQCLKVERRDGVILGLTSSDRAIKIGGQLYHAGFGASDMVSSAGLNVDNLEVTIFPGESMLTVSELAAGLWDNAKFTIFECNYRSTADGINVLKRGTTGEAQLTETRWTIEFRGLKQALQQSLGAVTSKTCRYLLGSTSMATGGLCRVVLAPFTFACTVTAVTSRYAFTDSARTQAAEWFVEGTVTFLTGANAGFAQKVKVFAAGQFTTALPMPFAVSIGDTFTAVTGCQKRHARTSANLVGVSDCIDKFNNILNFGGEPHLPGVDGLIALPTHSG